MIGNEELLMACPSQLMQINETMFRVETFDGTIDNNNGWVLNTPFSTASYKLSQGMIVNITQTSGVNSRSGVYIIKSVLPNALELRLPGHLESPGRGPSSLFGTSQVKVNLFDFSSIIKSAQKTVDSVVQVETTEEPALRSRVDDVVRTLSLLELSSYSELIMEVIELRGESIFQFRQRLLQELRLEYLRYLMSTNNSTGKWIRIVR